MKRPEAEQPALGQEDRLQNDDVRILSKVLGKARIRSVTERVEVYDHVIRITRDKAKLERVSSEGGTGGCSSIRKWCAGQDKTANTYVVEIAARE